MLARERRSAGKNCTVVIIVGNNSWYIAERYKRKIVENEKEYSVLLIVRKMYSVRNMMRLIKRFVNEDIYLSKMSTFLQKVKCVMYVSITSRKEFKA